MKNPRVHTHQLLAAGQQVELEPGPSQHLSRALRKTVGDPVILFNGDGMDYRAVLVAIGKRSVVAEVSQAQQQQVESPLQIHLGIAISRGERMDWVVQKATELGVTDISPLFSERTEVKLGGERAAKKLRHWQQVSISACEQCGRNRLPVISSPVELGGWLSAAGEDRKFVLHHRAGPGREVTAPPTSIALLVGPEGGLSEAEISAAEKAGFEALRLGPRVLRTETAPLAAIAILQARWGDMG